MNKSWYECKVKFRKTDLNGAQKVVTESYLVDGVSFTEAEARINEEMSAYISEEFRVTNIRLTNYSDLIFDEACENWFKSKVSLIAYSEETGKEQKQNIYMLVQGNDVEDAFDKIKKDMGRTMGDFTIPAVSETTIVEVFPYIELD